MNLVHYSLNGNQTVATIGDPVKHNIAIHVLEKIFSCFHVGVGQTESELEASQMITSGGGGVGVGDCV